MVKKLDNSGKKSKFFLFISVFAGVLAIGTLFLLLIANKQGLLGKTEDNSELISSADENMEEVSSEELVETVEFSTILPSEDISDTESEMEEIPEELPENTYRIEKEGNVTIKFCGDILLDDSYAVMSTFRNKGRDLNSCFTGGLMEEMTEADIFMVNNEFPYSDRGAPLPNKMYTFRANPDNVNIIKDMGADIVALANNHITDYGIESLEDTLTTLNDAGLPYVGAGQNIEEASKIVYFMNDDVKIAFLCTTQLERLTVPDTRGATEELSGTFRCWESTELLEQRIKEAKENADVVIVYIHWGSENVEPLDWGETSQAQIIADAGADVIVGDHPHILQQIGYVDDTLVFYSMGNYWFSSKTYNTGLASVEVNKGGVVSARFIPCVSSGCVLRKSEGDEKAGILNHLRGISTGVSIDEDGYITKSE